jgi:hypothetical protein
MTMPAFLLAAWLFFLLKDTLHMAAALVAGVAFVTSAAGLFLLCVIWTWIQGLDLEEAPIQP